jgi:hypothetical protein
MEGAVVKTAASTVRDVLARVAAVEPPDGATQVLRDAPVVLRLSCPLDPTTLTPESFWVQDPEGHVPGWVRLSPDLKVVIWGADRPLRAGKPHVVVASGLKDDRGRPVPPHRSAFVPCDLAREDLRL